MKLVNSLSMPRVNKLALFQNFLDYETFVKIVEMQRGQPCWMWMIEKLKFPLMLKWVKKYKSFHTNDDL